MTEVEAAELIETVWRTLAGERRLVVKRIMKDQQFADAFVAIDTKLKQMRVK